MGFVAFDTETTGVDLYHGAKPFMVTACTDEGEVTCWEWAVNPLTREPLIPEEDLDEIRTLLFDAERLILQNPKFDAAAMLSVGIDNWPWEKTEDTLTAGHLLASKMPHDLTSMAQQYLGIDIQPYEDRLEVACKKARNLARKHFPEWMIAKEGLPNMPSIKGGKGKESKGSESEKPWKNDMWLLRELVRELEPEYGNPEEGCDHDWNDDVCLKCEGHRWRILVSEYTVKDVEVTALLWSKQLELMRRRNLLDIYRTVVKRPKLAFTMERYGVTYSTVNHQEMVSIYEAESERQGARCVNIAESYGYTLELPKTSNNNSLRTFCFDHLCLPAVKRSEKTGEPSLDKEVMSHYLLTLPIKSRELTFIRSLLDKRSRDTALTYLAAYRRFSLPLEEGWELLHPSLNPTGSDTLRWTCANPNEQNISKREIACSYCAGDGCTSCGGSGKGLRSLRYCFGPAPGREWYSCDAKNIELRLPAYESGEPDMIALFEHPDDPPFYGSNHMLIFSVLWPDLWNAAVKEVGLEKAASYCKKKYADTNYQWTKNGNFAVQYGAIDRPDGTGTADRAYHLKGGQAIVKSRFKKQEALNNYWIDFANKHGYVETIPDKTVDPRRGYPLMCTRTEYGKILPTVPLNYHIQSSAMWWMMKAMTRCQEKLDQWNEEVGIPGHYRITMQIHDELVFDFPKSHHCPVAESKRLAKNPKGFKRPDCNLHKIRILQKLMEKGGDDFGIPTPTSCEYHEHNWSEGVAV